MLEKCKHKLDIRRADVIKAAAFPRVATHVSLQVSQIAGEHQQTSRLSLCVGSCCNTRVSLASLLARALRCHWRII